MIETAFLTEVADFVEGRIAKVVLNDNVEITAFETKSVNGASVTLQYIVPLGAVAVVTKVELKDEADAVISSNTVYVPIVSDTLLMQTIQVKEG